MISVKLNSVIKRFLNTGNWFCRKSILMYCQYHYNVNLTDATLKRSLNRMAVKGIVDKEYDQCDFCIGRLDHLLYRYISTSKYMVSELEELIYGYMVNVDHKYLDNVSKAHGGRSYQREFSNALPKILDVLLEMDILDL